MKRYYLSLGFVLLYLAANSAMADASGGPYKYCFKVHSDSNQIESATVKGYDHPWHRLFRPREIHSATFTSHDDRHCWKSELPEMGISMSYTVTDSQQGTNEFRCRKAPDPMTKYKPKTWNLVIRRKKLDESYPVDCRIE